MTLNEALEQANTGKAVVYSFNGGLKRYLRFVRISDYAINAYAYGRQIVTFRESGIYINACGYEHHITTREAINYCLSSPGLMHSRNNRIYVGASPYVPDIKVNYK